LFVASCQHTHLGTRDWYSCLFIGSYTVISSLYPKGARTPTLSCSSRSDYILHLYIPFSCYYIPSPTRQLDNSVQPVVAIWQRLPSPCNSISKTKMAAAVAQPNEDVTASSYVGFDCKSLRSPLPLSATAMSSIYQSMEKLTPSHHPSNRAQAPKTRFPIQRNGRRYVPSAVSCRIELINRSNWTGEINNDQHPLRITFDRIQRKDRT